MPRLIACDSCGLHVKSDEVTCPHCGAARRSAPSTRAGAVLMGLALAGCPADDDDTADGITVAQPAYGVPETEGPPGDGSGGDDGSGGTSTGAADSGSGSGSGSGSAGDTTGGSAGSDSVGEPDYGVPETTGG